MSKLLKRRIRLRRSSKFRAKSRELQVTRLVTYKSNKFIYAQIIQPITGGDKVLAAVTSKSFKASDKVSNVSIDSAKQVGEAIAKKAIENGIQKVAFDRSGYKYHGCIKALAEAAKNTGLQF